jgi:effector-binding domain-containing protein
MAIEESERVKMLTLPAVESMGCVIHQGYYETIQLAGDALLRWVEVNDYAIRGPMREVYYRFGADLQGYELPAGHLATKDEEFVTEIQVPLERN